MGSLTIRPRRTTSVRPLLLGLLGLLGLAIPVAAGGPRLETPHASFAFGREIVFEQPVDLALRPARVELLVETPGDLGPIVHPVVPPAGPGPATLRYTMTVADQHIVPNTPLEARWRIVDPGGAVTIGDSTRIVYSDTRFDWRARRGSLVRLHWYAGDESFASRALDVADNALQRASAFLGVDETEPVDLFIYAAHDPFYDALGPGTRENVGGEAHSDIRTMFALIGPGQITDDWVETVIAHELTHLVFNTAVENPYHGPPRWLNEGLAVYLAQGYRESAKQSVREAARAGRLIPLEGLVAEFPAPRESFFLAYDEGVSAVDFLIRSYGTNALVRMIRSYATGRTDDEAFGQSLGLDTEAFEAAWSAELGASQPQRYGPRAAAPGPLPPGWSWEPSTATAAPTSSLAGTLAPAPTASSAQAVPPMQVASPTATSRAAARSAAAGEAGTSRATGPPPDPTSDGGLGTLAGLGVLALGLAIVARALIARLRGTRHEPGSS